MTFENGAYAINGAEIGAALARRALYANARDGGIVQKDDLKVTPLAVPGVGVLVTEGVGIVLNDYQDDPNEVYVASNPSTHTIPAIDMPASSPSARSFILAVVIGDPDFSQAGHPWMPSTVPPGEESTFEYVRPTLIQVSAGATSLNVPYPALPLARIDIPANTTTITGAMIVDLRKLSQVRQSQQMFVSGNAWNAQTRVIPAGEVYADWGAAEFNPQVVVPTWAVRAIVVASINGVRITDSSTNARGGVRAQLGNVSGPATLFDVPTGTGAVRENLMAAGEYNVAALAGQTVGLRVEGFQNAPAVPTANQKLTLMNGSSVIYDVRFFEE